MQDEAESWLATASFIPPECAISYTYTTDGKQDMCYACDALTSGCLVWSEAPSGQIISQACGDCYAVFSANINALKSQCVDCVAVEDLKEAYKRKALLLGLGTLENFRACPGPQRHYHCVWKDCRSYLRRVVFTKYCESIVCVSCLAELKALSDTQSLAKLAQTDAVYTRRTL